MEQEFQVVAYDEEEPRPPPAGFGVVNVSLVDEVYLPEGSTAVTCEILNQNDGSVILSSADATIQVETVGTGSVHAVAEFNNPTLSVGEYIAHWRYEVGVQAMHDYRQAFVISAKTASVVSNLRMFLDQSGVTKYLAHFAIADVELVDCLYRGADRINAAPPQATQFNPDNIPFGLVSLLRDAALHEMLNRLYLSEGLAAFDFQGGSISVNVDRTPFIQTKMDEINSRIESTLQPAKSVTLARGNVGILHVSVSTGGENNNYRSRHGLVRPSLFQLSRSYNFAGSLLV